MTFLTKLKTGFRSLWLTCRQASRIQSADLDQPLSALQRLGLVLHLIVCKWCNRYGKQLRFLHRVAHKHPDKLVEVAPQKLTAEARERIKHMIATGN